MIQRICFILGLLLITACSPTYQRTASQNLTIQNASQTGATISFSTIRCGAKGTYSVWRAGVSHTEAAVVQSTFTSFAMGPGATLQAGSYQVEAKSSDQVCTGSLSFDVVASQAQTIQIDCQCASYSQKTDESKNSRQPASKK